MRHNLFVNIPNVESELKAMKMGNDTAYIQWWFYVRAAMDTAPPHPV